MRLDAVDKWALVVNSAGQMSQNGVSVSANTLRVSPHSWEAVKLMGSRVRKRMMGEQHQAHLPTPDLYVSERHSIQKHTHVHSADTNSLCQDGRKQTDVYRSLPLTGQWDPGVPKARENCSVWVRRCVLGIALQKFRGKPGVTCVECIEPGLFARSRKSILTMFALRRPHWSFQLTYSPLTSARMWSVMSKHSRLWVSSGSWTHLLCLHVANCKLSTAKQLH